MPPFRESAQVLLRTPEFADLFSSEQSPVHAEIERLVRLSQDTRIVDPARMASIKWKLEGMRIVERLVRECAASADAPEVPVVPPSRFESLRSRTARYGLRRGLTG